MYICIKIRAIYIFVWELSWLYIHVYTACTARSDVESHVKRRSYNVVVLDLPESDLAHSQFGQGDNRTLHQQIACVTYICDLELCWWFPVSFIICFLFPSVFYFSRHRIIWRCIVPCGQLTSLLHESITCSWRNIF